MTPMTLPDSPHPPWRRPPQLSDPQDLRTLLELTAAIVFEVPLEAVTRALARRREVAFARQSAMYLAHIVLRHELQRGRHAVRPRPHHRGACLPDGRGPARRSGHRRLPRPDGSPLAATSSMAARRLAVLS